MWVIGKTNKNTKEEVIGERKYDTFARAQNAIKSEYPEAKEIDPGTFETDDVVVKIVYQ